MVVNTNILQALVMAMQHRLAALSQRLRSPTTEFDELPRNLMLTGARRCGKSAFLPHYSQGRCLLCLSADSPRIIGGSLYDLVSSMFVLGYEGIIIDEIHYISNRSIHLKALYNDYPGKIIWISDPSSLVLRGGKANLSRCYIMIQIPLTSFRELLCLETGQIHPKYKLGDTVLPTQPDAGLLNHSLNHRSCGTCSFYQEKDFEVRYMAIIDKILNSDISFFLPSTSENDLHVMRAIIGTLANSPIPRVQVTSSCSDWGIGAEKLYQLLLVMESVDLLEVVRHPNDTRAHSTGAKMLFADPCAYKILNADQRTERETYIVHCFSRAGYEINAVRDEKKGDYVITKDHALQTLEVGGKNKNPKGADYILRDNTDYPVGNAILFRLMGMMWQSFAI